MTAYYNEIDETAAAWLRELIKQGHIAPGDVDTRSIVDVRPDDLAGYTQCHFFAGIGTWSYALRRAGWPDYRQVWTFSCPCQPFSAAGKGDGFADERHLWPFQHHLIVQRRPANVFGEQVASKGGLAWLDLVQADLEAAYYAFGAFDLCAAGFGAPHIRQRSYLAGYDPTAIAEWVGNGVGPRLEGHCRHVGHGDESGRIITGAVGPTAEAGSTGRMAYDNGRDTCAEGLQRGGEYGLFEENGSSGERLANPYSEDQSRWGIQRSRQSDAKGVGATCERSEGLCTVNGLADSCSGQLPQSIRGSETRDGFGPDCANDDGSAGWTGPTNGFWRDADWLFCRDELWRPVESGTFPLANGIAGRMGRLRGYGNGIVAPQAQAFIESYLEAEAAGFAVDVFPGAGTGRVDEWEDLLG